MAQSQEVSRPGNEQYLIVKHDGDEYEAKKQRFQRELNGELRTVEEYRPVGDDEDWPDEVVAEVRQANAVRQTDSEGQPEDA